MLLSEFVRAGIDSLVPLYPKEEAREMVLRLCEDLAGTNRYAYLLSPKDQLPLEKERMLTSALVRLQGGEPLQYVLGYADFCDRRFKVNRSCLIPRPETQLLVKEAVSVIRQRKTKGRVIDLCTGSGCIAWSVLFDCPEEEIVATDISPDALSVASSQFDSPLSPYFVQYDIFASPKKFGHGMFDVLLCNPPYICEKEKSEMRKNVLDFEPPLALFIPDSDPLLYYKAISEWAKAVLAKGGVGIVETNENFGEQTASLLRESGLKNTEILRDQFNKNRFVEFVKD